ncbi:MAG: alpha/beta hydrolase [Caldilinea sp. CFX5]|nr:alpha/beta hydrolase [Caldilinea sp. CFX5]
MTGETQKVTSGYADVNGLQMYYEIHGAAHSGPPLVVLHGAYMTIHAMGKIVPLLAQSRQVIAAEMQGHGHTADIDRPLTYEQMADDVAALLEQLNVEQADVLGYSMGGGVAIQVAVRHPAVVRKLVIVSMYTNNEGAYPELFPTIEQITPEVFAETPWKAEYDQVAPNPEDFPTLVSKLKELDLTFAGWPAEEVASITAPTLIVIGDSDVVRPEHAVDLFRLLGGGVFGDLAGLPASQLAVLPGTTHVGMVERADWLVPMITAFLDAPLPASKPE